MFNRKRKIMREFRVMSPLRYALTVGLALAFNIAAFNVSHSQIANPGAQISGSVTFNDCVKMGPGVGQIQDAGAGCASQASGANPTATAGAAAVNGVATTFMRSDAAPAVQQASGATAGITSGANPTATASTSAVNGTSNNFMRADAAPAVASTTFGGQSVGPGGSATVQGNGAKIQLSTGTVVSGNCAKFDVNGNVIDNGAVCGGASGANPTATASNTANNGVATTFMRSDASPAVQLGSNAQLGLAEGDGTSISLSSGVASSVKASKSDMQTGTDANKSVTPSIANQSDSAAKAWATFSGTTGTSTATYNASTSRTGTGSYTVTFTTAFATVNYACVMQQAGNVVPVINTKAVGSITLNTINFSAALTDATTVDIVCFGRQ